MVAKNDITGNEIKSRWANNSYRNNWDTIFKNNVWLEKNDNHFNIIIDYENNANCFLRLNEIQFNKLCERIKDNS